MLNLTAAQHTHLAQMMTRQAEMLRQDGMDTEAVELLERALSLKDAARHDAQGAARIH